MVSALSTLMGYMSSETLKSPSRSQTERQGGQSNREAAWGRQTGFKSEILPMPSAALTLYASVSCERDTATSFAGLRG